MPQFRAVYVAAEVLAVRDEAEDSDLLINLAELLAGGL